MSRSTIVDFQEPGGREWADCDCCGKYRPLSQVWFLGHIETWACDECRGEAPIGGERDDEDLRYHTEIGNKP